MRQSLWRDLKHRRLTLLAQSDWILRANVLPSIRMLFTNCKKVLQDSGDAMLRMTDELSKQSTAASPPISNLRLACGVPGVLGCASARGEKVLWEPLLHRKYGLRSAFDALGLDLAGLPPARLPSDLKLPGGSGWFGVMCGGPSYHSCAVLWEQRLGSDTVVPRLDLGSSCRIWVCIIPSGLARWRQTSFRYGCNANKWQPS